MVHAHTVNNVAILKRAQIRNPVADHLVHRAGAEQSRAEENSEEHREKNRQQTLGQRPGLEAIRLGEYWREESAASKLASEGSTLRMRPYMARPSARHRNIPRLVF